VLEISTSDGSFSGLTVGCAWAGCVCCCSCALTTPRLPTSESVRKRALIALYNARIESNPSFLLERRVEEFLHRLASHYVGVAGFSRSGDGFAGWRLRALQGGGARPLSGICSASQGFSTRGGAGWCQAWSIRVRGVGGGACGLRGELSRHSPASLSRDSIRCRNSRGG